MSRRALNKKYLNLSNVRVAYRPNDDTIHLTSTDRDLAGEAFRITLKPDSDADYILRQLLFEKGLINKELSVHGLLPEIAALKLDASSPWNLLPLGEGVDGQVSIDSGRDNNILIGGSTGGGKSVMLRNFIHHCLTHNDQWAVYGVDFKKIELTPYLRYENTVREVATTITETYLMLLKLKREMERRYELMEKQGVNHVLDLDTSDPEVGDTKALMIIVDEAYDLFKGWIKDSDSENREYILQLIEEIARLGRAAGIHTVIASQMIHKAGVYPFMHLFTARIACGRLHLDVSEFLVGDELAERIPKTRGRGFMLDSSGKNYFQSYFSSPSSGDEWVLQNGPNLEPELYEELLKDN